MLGKLEEEEVEKLLKEQYIGRLGCHAHGVSYIVPINYVYRSGTVYAHSAPGQKIRLTRSATPSTGKVWCAGANLKKSPILQKNKMFCRALSTG